MTKRFYIVKDLDLVEFRAENEWGYPRHKHNFYELTFILEGSGKHLLNDSSIQYKKGDVFFLSPNDEHEFVIDQPSTFGVIKFTEQLFMEKSSSSVTKQWTKNLETVIFHSNIIAESIVKYESDTSQFLRLYNLIKEELQNPLAYSRHLLMEFFGALLIILSRNLKSSNEKNIITQGSSQERIEGILTYIRQNINNKEKISIKEIAKEFNLSPNYVSVFIKKHTGLSLQQYTMENKMKIAERLLLQTNLNINEISNKIGFVDASHFNKTFKKYAGLNPSEFKRKL